MTTTIWIAFFATAMFIVLLPSPLSCLTANYSLQRGRRAAVATVPGIVVGLSVALMVGAVPVALLAFYTPALFEVLSWAGLAYLMLYVLWSYQDPSVASPIADNDNIPELQAGRILGLTIRKALFTPRYLGVLIAVLTQFVEPKLPLLPQLLEMQATFVVGAVIALAVHIHSPRRILGRKRNKAVLNPAARHLKTRFITSRAVTAGYRRIAA